MFLMEKRLKAVVLAAGKGTRLHEGDNDVPKVMRRACGKPLLWYVLDALSFIEKKDTIIVVGYKKDEVTGSFTGYRYALQEEQMGTGHAVMAAGDVLSGYEGALLVCYGDMPVIRRETYEGLLNAHFEQSNACTILTGESSLQLPFGRILRDENGGFLHVVEEKDCTPQQLKITELNTGVYVFDTPMLFEAFKELKNENAQGEYYVTDVPAIMRGKGAKIGIYRRDLGDEIIGVNTVEQLLMVEEILSTKQGKVDHIE
jgi:UDP-N-acetylglucosamine diphosphorylase/glucosamine-1-phosphate N-acetyltransferase